MSEGIPWRVRSRSGKSEDSEFTSLNIKPEFIDLEIYSELSQTLMSADLPTKQQEEEKEREWEREWETRIFVQNSQHQERFRISIFFTIWTSLMIQL